MIVPEIGIPFLISIIIVLFAVFLTAAVLVPDFNPTNKRIIEKHRRGAVFIIGASAVTALILSYCVNAEVIRDRTKTAFEALNGVSIIDINGAFPLINGQTVPVIVAKGNNLYDAIIVTRSGKYSLRYVNSPVLKTPVPTGPTGIYSPNENSTDKSGVPSMMPSGNGVPSMMPSNNSEVTPQVLGN